MQNFAELHFKPQVLARYSLPDTAYMVPVGYLQAAMRDDEELPLTVMLYGLQQRSCDGKSAWQPIEVAMERLANLLTSDDDRKVVTVASDNWWLEIGSVDLDSKLVTVQRGDSLIAAIASRDDGRLRVEVFRPLDAKSAEYLSFWKKGIGISWDGTEVPEWRTQKDLVPRRAAMVATELGVHYTLSVELRGRLT